MLLPMNWQSKDRSLRINEQGCRFETQNGSFCYLTFTNVFKIYFTNFVKFRQIYLQIQYKYCTFVASIISIWCKIRISDNLNLVRNIHI